MMTRDGGPAEPDRRGRGTRVETTTAGPVVPGSEVGAPDPSPSRPRWARVATHPVAWLLGSWTVLNLAWLWGNRRSRLFELDEAGYARMAVSFSRQRSWDGVVDVLHEGNHGPLQAVLAAPPQWLTGPDPATLLWQNVVFGTGAAAAVYVMVARLAGRRPALAATAITLLSPGVIEHSRVAMTVMPSVLFAAVAMMALVLGRGLGRGRWAVVAGAAVGCMTLSRSMTIGFVPVLGIAALGWVVSERTPIRVALRNGALAAATAAAAALWWWVMRWDDVSTYLFGGGSADTVRTQAPVAKARLHADELVTFTGRSVLVVGALAFGVLFVVARIRSRAEDGSSADAAPDRPGALDAAGAPSAALDLALWPMALAVLAGLAVLGFGTATGIGFVMPLLPWAVTVGSAAVGRTLRAGASGLWALAVTLVAVATVPITGGSGLTSELIWCANDQPRSNCAVDSDAEGRAWNRAIAEVADRIWRAQATRPGDFDVALLTRDLLLNENGLGLELELRHDMGVDFSRFFRAGTTELDQYREMVADADLLVAAEDFRPDQVILGTYQPAPGTTVALARASGFRACDEIVLPDGRIVTVLAAPTTPDAACE